MTNTSKTTKTSGTNKRLVFFGNERLVSGLKHTDAPILRGLIKAGYDIAAVVSHHSDGASRNNRELEVAEIAKAHDIPLLLPNKPSEIINELRALNADAAILVAYGRIIGQSVIDLFPHGIINIHPSLLPKYRGPTPIESAIINGDTQTGVSIMQLTAGMDEGPVFAQATVDLKGFETKFDLYDVLAKQSATLLFDTLPQILSGELAPQEQQGEPTYSHLLDKNDGRLDPSSITATQAERSVRAYLGYPKTKLTVLGQPVIVTKAHISSEQKTPLDLMCQDGEFLSIDELIGPSGRSMSGTAFLNGYAA